MEGSSFSRFATVVLARSSRSSAPNVVVGVGAVKPEREMREAVTSISSSGTSAFGAVCAWDTAETLVEMSTESNLLFPLMKAP
jgi:hypothetical protein